MFPKCKHKNEERKLCEGKLDRMDQEFCWMHNPNEWLVFFPKAYGRFKRGIKSMSEKKGTKYIAKGVAVRATDKVIYKYVEELKDDLQRMVASSVKEHDRALFSNGNPADTVKLCLNTINNPYLNDDDRTFLRRIIEENGDCISEKPSIIKNLAS